MSIQLAELHFVSEPRLIAEAIATRSNELTHSDVGYSGSDRHEGFCFHHTRFVRPTPEGSGAPQTVVTRRPAADGTYDEIVEQSWGCSDAAERLATTRSVCTVTERMTSTLDPQMRLELFHGVLQAVVELTEPHAIIFLHSSQVVAPDDYLDSCSGPPIERSGALNTRFYSIENSPDGDMIMDTRGLADIGLHDLQCRFRELSPDEVSRVLYSTALYLVENGPVIESGETITGADPGSMWGCRFEESLLQPKRTVLDLNPGPPYAANGQ